MDQEKMGRLIFRTQGEFYESFVTLVKSGGHIFVDGSLTIKILTARMYSRTGKFSQMITWYTDNLRF